MTNEYLDRLETLTRLVDSQPWYLHDYIAMLSPERVQELILLARKAHDE
jgi:hypothetical protein